MAFVFLLRGLQPESQTMPKAENREPKENVGVLLRDRQRESRDRLRRGLLEAGASESCLLGLPGPGPEVLYLGAPPDGTAESSIVAGDDGAVHQGVGEAWGLGEVQGLVVGWLICNAWW